MYNEDSKCTKPFKDIGKYLDYENCSVDALKMNGECEMFEFTEAHDCICCKPGGWVPSLPFDGSNIYVAKEFCNKFDCFTCLDG